MVGGPEGSYFAGAPRRQNLIESRMVLPMGFSRKSQWRQSGCALSNFLQTAVHLLLHLPIR